MSPVLIHSDGASARVGPDTKASAVLAAMADGIGDLTFASPEWVEAAQAAFSAAASKHADALKDFGRFTLCEVAHNPPAYLHGDGPLAWHLKFDGAKVEAHVGEMPDEACGLKTEGDHSIMSNLSRIQHHGKDPEAVAAARARLEKLSRWEVKGSIPRNGVLEAVLRSAHDAMAVRTMPRFVWMTPELVSVARHIVSTRAASEEFSDTISDVVYTFSEEFIDTPRYALPDGSHGGFWVHCNHGQVAVGAGPLPKGLEPAADHLMRAMYTPCVPLGRTVNAAMTETEQAEQKEYTAAAFKVDEETGKKPAEHLSPSGKGPLPPKLKAIMSVLHDELSKRTSGELPSDFDKGIKPEWSTPQRFDRSPGYDPTWLRYGQVDIYGDTKERVL